MPDITQSFSQLLLTYGPGAMLDLPEHAVVIAGLQDWQYGPGAEPLHEERLVRLLRDQLGHLLSPHFWGLRSPPNHDEERHDEQAPGIGVRIFPTWFTVDGEEATDDEDAVGAEARKGETWRRMVRFEELDRTVAGKLTFKPGKKKLAVNPIRFVAACSKGHLQDIDWRFVSHRGGQTSCRKPLYWVERGVTSDPADISIRCRCGASVSLSDLYKPGFLGSCGSSSPWLDIGEAPEEACPKELKLLPRSATNTYFAQVISVISLTKSDERLRLAIEEHQADIDSIRSLPNFIQFLRMHHRTREVFANFSDDEILRSLDEDTTVASGSSPHPKIPEYDLLASGAPTIGRDGNDSNLFAETLDRASLDIPAQLDRLLGDVVTIHRLREVTCLYGFTRLEPPPTAAESEMDEIQLFVDGAPLHPRPEWLPAIEQFGEGIFLRFNAEELKSWMSQAGVQQRAEEFKLGERADADRFQRDPKHLGIAYWALHSLSHAFMSELALGCGYPLTSLKERVYAGTSGTDDRFGIMIYTASAGSQGTLGGLSSMAKSAPRILERAIGRLRLCSNDPVCAEHGPVDDLQDRPLHGAACHACLLVPETSCEARNTRLDRTVLIDTISRSDLHLLPNVQPPSDKCV